MTPNLPIVLPEDVAAAEDWRDILCHRDGEYEGDVIADLAAAFARHRTQAIAEERHGRLGHIRKLEAALRVCRGWLITCSSSAQARRDLKTLDAALAIRQEMSE